MRYMRRHGDKAGPKTTEEWIRFEADQISKLHTSSVWKWRAISVWIAIFSGFALFAWHQNQDRIKDIQKSRFLACEENYTAIQRVLDLSFLSVGIRLREDEVQRYQEIRREVDPRKCRETTKPKK